MKKSLFMLGLATVALASCTNEEVTEVAQNRAINFTPFVNSNTKAVTEVTTSDLQSFYVFGNYGTNQSTGPWTGTAFNNEVNTAEYYWQVGNYYRFGAYADGNNGKINNVVYDPSTQTLTFSSYTPDDSKDLVAAIGTGDASTQAPTDAVPLTFKHLLSQVKLTFTTDAAATYQLTITNVKINSAVNTANGTYNGETTWTGDATGSYSYSEFDEGKVISSGVNADQVKLVIPQNGTNNIKVTFTATIEGEAPTGSTTLTANFEATLGHTISGGDLAENTWTNGYRYNYTAKVNISDIVDNPDDLVQIEFTPTVEEWKDASEEATETTPTQE